MRTKFYLDTRGRVSHDLEQVYPIRIAINHGGSSAYIATGVCVSEEQWESKPSPGRVVRCARAARLNIALAEKKLAVDKAIEELRLAGELHGASASQIKAAVERRLAVLAYGTANGELPVGACLERFVATKSKPRTAEVYRATLHKLRGFDEYSETMTFHTMTAGWLTRFDAYLARTSPSANARGIYLRCIRALFNYALAEELTDAPYPFKRYKIKMQPTRDRSLSREQLLALRDAPCYAPLEKYRDLFFLSFYLCGMNLEDILGAREIKDGRIEVLRIKTGQPLSVRIEPEAQRIIDKYSGNGRLIDINESISYRNFRARLNRYLKRIGKTYNPHTKQWEGVSVMPDLTYYYARYSWATIAAELDIPERTIGAALGHSTAKTVTSIYTRVDMRRKIDVANRAVIDFVVKENLHE